MKLPNKATKKQKMLFEYGKNNPYSILAADMRLGKSATAIWLQQSRSVNTLIVCPGHLVPNWKKEVLKWSPKSQVTIFQKGSEIYEPCDSDFVVISYDLVQKAEHLFEWADMIIADEVHNLKSMAAKRTQFFHKALYENSIKYFHGLTGTPLKNRVKEFYSLLALTYYDPRIDDGVKVDLKNQSMGFNDFVGKYLPKTGNKHFLEMYPDELTFAERFSYRQSFDVKVTTKKGATFYQQVIKYEGLRNLPELKTWLRGRYIRVRADKNDLPPIVYQDVLISDSPDIKLLDAFNAFFNDDTKHSVKPDIKVEAALKKVPFTIKYVENLVDTVDCCLIYSDHKEPVKKIAQHFGCPAITGEMPGKKRAALVKEFQEGKINMLCATIGSLKEGSDLFRAKDMVLNDYCWVPGDMLQVINRIRALGEKDPRLIHRVFGSPQDEKIMRAIEEKMKVIDRAT